MGYCSAITLEIAATGVRGRVHPPVLELLQRPKDRLGAPLAVERMFSFFGLQYITSTLILLI